MRNSNPFNRQGDYETFIVEKEQPLLEYLLEHVKTLSRGTALTGVSVGTC